MGGRSVLRSLRLAAAIVAAALALSVAAIGAPPALAAPTGAPRLPKVFHIPIPAFTTISARAAATHGYRFGLYGSYEAPVKRETDGRSVSYLDITLKRGSTEASYEISDTVAPDGTIAASLGSLGRLDLRFVPRQVTGRPPGPGCDRSEKVERGVLRGTVAFHGENGYTDLATEVLRGTLATSPEALCTFHPRRTRGHESHESIRFGGQWSRGRNRFVDFTAYEHPGLGTATLRATSSERRGPIMVSRNAKTVVPAGDAPFDQAAGTASVAASAPFSGSAQFRAFPGKEAGTWLGPLSVDFPGRPGVHLAGHRYQGSLLSGNECGPDQPGFDCIGVRFPSPIGLSPVRRPG